MRRRSFTRPATVATMGAILIVCIGAAVVCLVHQRRVAALFEGETTLSVTRARAFRPREVYDLSRYLAGDIGHGKGQALNAAMLGIGRPVRGSGWSPRGETWNGKGTRPLRASVDAVSAATRVVRLRVPSVYKDPLPAETLAISYPRQSALFPPNLCEPCVEWDDPVNNLWQVVVGLGQGPGRWTFVCRDRHWRFPRRVWRTVRKEAVHRDAWVQVKGVQRQSNGLRTGPIQASERVRFRVSRDPADHCIVYRLVMPPFSRFKTPDTFVRDIRSFKTRVFLRSRNKYCFNCHTFSSKQGTRGRLGIQARFVAPDPCDLPVYFGVYDISARRGWKVRLPFTIQMTTFMAWSPDGTKLATSANQKIATLSPIIHETQMAGGGTSDIAVYDLDRNTACLLPGASDPDRLEVFPRWTPDGELIVFCSARSGSHPGLVRYDLSVVPFNGGKGGNSALIPGASRNGKSNYFPRFSPDGKWLSFCQANNGDLIRSSSDIWLAPGNLKGTAHRLACNVDYAADSWHSWSSNSRWLVFASKRDDGVYARLYLTHIDDRGRASPAVRLPLKEQPVKCFNIPEFVAEDPKVAERALYDAIRVEGPALAIKRGNAQ